MDQDAALEELGQCDSMILEISLDETEMNLRLGESVTTEGNGSHNHDHYHHYHYPYPYG